MLYGCNSNQPTEVNNNINSGKLYRPYNYYSPAAGKSLGIWLHYDQRCWTTAKLRELTKYGITYLHIYYDPNMSDPDFQYHQAVSASISSDRLICLLKPHFYGDFSNTTNLINTMYTRGIRRFYIDEPLEAVANGVWESSFIKDSIIVLANYLRDNYPEARLYIGSCTDFIWITPRVTTSEPIAKDYWDILSVCSNVFMMNDSYTLSANQQISFWQNFYYNYYIDYERRSLGHFTDNVYDASEYSSLFSGAQQLGLNYMCLYNANSIDDWTSIRNFCEAAYSAGWLTKLQDPPATTIPID